MQVPGAGARRRGRARPGRVVTFKLPGSGARLTLAIQPDLKRANDTARELALVLPAWTRWSSRARRRQGWLWLRQEAKATVGGAAYVGQFFAFRSTLVAVLLAIAGRDRRPARDLLEARRLSIRYHEPAVDTGGAWRRRRPTCSTTP